MFPPLACRALSGGVAQVPRAVGDAPKQRVKCVWEILRERLVDSFIYLFFYLDLSQKRVPSVISLPVFSTSVYLVTSAAEFTHRASAGERETRRR